MLNIKSKVFRAKKDETFSALLKRVNNFISEKADKGYDLDKNIVSEKLIVVDYWVSQQRRQTQMKPLRPSLKFISILPTIKIKEEVETTHMVIWKVELDKPVNIMSDHPTVKSLTNLTTFYVEAVTLKSEKRIDIKMNIGSCTYFITPRDEEWYLNNKWWEWAG